MHRRNGATTISEPATPLDEVCGAVEPADGLRLRQWRATDAPSLVDAWADIAISRWNPVPPDASLDFASSWIDGTASQTIASIGIDVVIVNDDDIVLGEIGLQVDPERSIAELGFWLQVDARGKGVARTLLVLAERLASQLELGGLIALVDPENQAANTLLANAGWNELPTRSQRRAFARRLD